MGLIVQNNNEVQKIIKIFKRSNSDNAKFGPRSRLRSNSSEEEESKRMERIQRDFKLRTRSGKLGTCYPVDHYSKLSLLDYNGENGRLEICTIACLFTKMSRENLTKNLSLFQNKGSNIFETFLECFDDTRAKKQQELFNIR